jgi:predicted Co/Zn/Cd cation transporter (cation efflux family)
VLDARPAIAVVISLFGVFIGVECRPHRVIADGMREELKSALIEFCHRSLVFIRFPEKGAFRRRIIAARLEHRCGMRLDDAIETKRDHAGRNPIV